jgi:ribonuclease T2
MEQGYPSFCEPSGRFVPTTTLEEAKGLFPSDTLALYEWRKHGSCSGESPGGYFKAVRRALDRVRIPDSFNALNDRSKVLPSEIEQAFMSVNPGLRPDMIAVSCGRRILQEVRICLDKDLRGFHQCPEVDRDGCRSGEIAIPAIR